jgi:N-acetylneuraminic acid mutarotase
VVAYGNYVYLWGGRNDENACKTLFRFDTKKHVWCRPTVTGNMPGARDGHSAIIIRNKMIIFGGYEEDIGLFSQDIYALDLNTLTWSLIPTFVCCYLFKRKSY